MYGRHRAVPLLLFGVSHLALVPDRQDQYDILSRQPAVLRDVTVPAAGQHELAATVFGRSTEQRVIHENLECGTHARELCQRELRIGLGNEIEQPREIAERAGAYFDARHERARGRRGFLPRTLAAR